MIARRIHPRYSEGVGAGDLNTGDADRDAWIDVIRRIPGLSYHADPYKAGTLNSQIETVFRDNQSDAPIMTSTGKPTLVESGLAGRRGFSFVTGPVTFTDMHVNAPLGLAGGIEGTFTFFTTIQGAAASLNGAASAILLSSYDEGGQKFFCGTRAHATPQFMMGHDGTASLFWVFGSKLVAGSIHFIMGTVNSTTGEMKIFADYPENYVAILTGETIVAYPTAKWYIGGQQLGASCWKGIFGDMLIFEGVDLSTLSRGLYADRLFAGARAYYQ